MIADFDKLGTDEKVPIWQWGLDIIALLPVIGAVKYTDEAAVLFKQADKIGNSEKYIDELDELMKHADEFSDVGKNADEAGEVSKYADELDDAGKGGNDKGGSIKNSGIDTIKSTLGNEIDVTPSSKHTSVNKNPGPYGEANTSVDILDAEGNIKTRRWYDSDGKAYRDVDMSDHGNPKEHPEVPHEHTWEYNNGKPKRN